MNTSLILSLVGLAAADSLNPFTVAAQAYLLGTPRPMPRSLTFLIATFATYLAGGLLLVAGLAVFVRRVLPLIPAWGPGVGEVVLAILCAGAGWYTARHARAGKPFTPPADLSIGATLVFAVVSTMGDLPTAIPLFAAAARITAAGLAWPVIAIALVGYVLIYCAPLLALVVLRATLSERRADKLFGRLRAGVDWAFAKLLPPLLWLAALALAADGAIRLAVVLR